MLELVGEYKKLIFNQKNIYFQFNLVNKFSFGSFSEKPIKYVHHFEQIFINKWTKKKYCVPKNMLELKYGAHVIAVTTFY